MKKTTLILAILVLCISLVGCSGQPEPDIDQIKSDLIGGRLILEGYHVWTFAALAEFEQFDIRRMEKRGDILEYDVSMRLHDLATDEHFLADALVVYKRTDGEWEITSVVTKLFQPIYAQ